MEKTKGGIAVFVLSKEDIANFFCGSNVELLNHYTFLSFFHLSNDCWLSSPLWVFLELKSHLGNLW